MPKINLYDIQIEINHEDVGMIQDFMNSKEEIVHLAQECFDLNIKEKEISDKLKYKRDQLKNVFEEYKINKIITDDFTMSYILSKKLTGWDEEETKNMIPEEHLFASMSFDKKKIEALIETKQIPKGVLSFMRTKTTRSIRFTPTPVDDTQTD